MTRRILIGSLLGFYIVYAGMMVGHHDAHAAANTTISLIGGGPTDAAGQTLVYDAGVSRMQWSGIQPWTETLDPRMRLQVALRDGMTFPAGNGWIPGDAGITNTSKLWVTQDEPWWFGVPASFIRKQVDMVHAAGLVALTNQGWSWRTSKWPTVAAIAAYPGDIISMDAYPNSAHPGAQIASRTALMHKASHGRPVWVDLQVCSRSNFATGKYPTAAREWQMAKAALDNGATGIQFFGSGFPECFKTIEDSTAGFNWSAWRSTVLPTIRRIRAYQP